MSQSVQTAISAALPELLARAGLPPDTASVLICVTRDEDGGAVVRHAYHETTWLAHALMAVSLLAAAVADISASERDTVMAAALVDALAALEATQGRIPAAEGETE